MTHVDCIHVQVIDPDGLSGVGEAVGVDHAGETVASMLEQVDQVRGALELGLSAVDLQALLPAGGARNAIDCALWDLQAKRSGVPAWQRCGLAALDPVETAFTLGIMGEAELRVEAARVADHALLKVKTDAEHGLDPVRIVHEVAPRARLIVDPNQGWTASQLQGSAGALQALNVVLLEQPVSVQDDACLDTLRLPLPVAADEAFIDRESLPRLVGRYQVVNIKLDKTGGLTEALLAAREARRRGFALMVGCMVGSSLSMAPAMLVAQGCRYVDLDGPLLQAADCEHPMVYQGGRLLPPTARLWG
jgi:L-alanine-DL-glutamate epimerase-like enolase superfamily enzyme